MRALGLFFKFLFNVLIGDTGVFFGEAGVALKDKSIFHLDALLRTYHVDKKILEQLPFQNIRLPCVAWLEMEETLLRNYLTHILYLF